MLLLRCPLGRNWLLTAHAVPLDDDDGGCCCCCRCVGNLWQANCLIEPFLVLVLSDTLSVPFLKVFGLFLGNLAAISLHFRPRLLPLGSQILQIQEPFGALDRGGSQHSI